MTYLSNTWSVPDCAVCTAVVPRLSRSEPTSLCLLTRPERERFDDVGGVPALAYRGVAEIDDDGVISPVLSAPRPMLVLSTD